MTENHAADKDTAKKRKGIAIGEEFFKRIIERNSYFVDKTLLIRDLLESDSRVTLFTRPRRFGKTLNQLMLKAFLEDERTESGEKIDNGHLFDGLKIMDCGEDILKHQQQYPVIFMTLKGAKQPRFDLAYMSLKRVISEEYKRHRYVLQSDALTEEEKKRFWDICNVVDDDNLYTQGIGFLSQCLSKYHKKNTIILIDEYDVPLENAYTKKFYGEMIDFIRSLFESALKKNPYLEKAVITGCLRISKESIFTGLNNMAVDSVLNTRYPDSFGFTQAEVSEMLAYYGLESQQEEVKRWYDGYVFGETEIYNPWSIIKYVDANVSGAMKYPRPYWSNTSSNSIVRELVYDANEDDREELEILINGGAIEKPVHEDITYAEVRGNRDNLWNFLFFTGYLKTVGQRTEKNRVYLTLKIPNVELSLIYEDSIREWFKAKVETLDRSALIRAFESGNCEGAEEFLSQVLMDTISYYDYAENYYHAFLAGLLVNSGRYIVRSNKESGLGRPDIVLEERKFMGRAIILEIKVATRFTEMNKKCEEALTQIEEGRYEQPLIDDGYQEILKYGICFFKKGCRIKKSCS